MSSISAVRRALLAAAVAVTVLPVTTAAAHQRPSIVKSDFGTLADGTHIDKYTLTNAQRMSISVITYGATLQSVYVPDRSGHLTNVALGFGSIDGYT